MKPQEILEKRKELEKDFDSQLDILIHEFYEKAEELGGQFLAPGIQYDLNVILKRKIIYNIKAF